jgi:methionyl-tRNA formyltransferase
MVEVLADPDAYPPVPQPDEGMTHAAKIDKAEARLDFARSATEAERQVRAFNPAPGAFFEVDGERIRVLAAEVAVGEARTATITAHASGFAIGCGEGLLVPTLVQRAGRAAMTPAELTRGFAIPEGTILS